MVKRCFPRAVSLAALLVASVMLMCATALPAFAAQEDMLTTGQGNLQTAEIDSYPYYVSSDWDTVYLAVGGTQEINLYDLRSTYYYDSDWYMTIRADRKGFVSYEAISREDALFSVKGKRAGEVTLTCTEHWTEYEGDYDDDWNWVETPVKKTQKHQITLCILSLKNKTGKLSKCAVGQTSWGSTSYSAKFTYKIAGLPADAYVEVVSDSNKKGSAYIDNVAKGKVTLNVSGVGTHTIKLQTYGKTITCVAVLRALSLKDTIDVHYTKSLISYPGYSCKLGVKLSGVKNPKVKWRSSNPKIVSVTKSGKTKGKSKGRCYLYATAGGATIKVLAEVTSYKAFWACWYAFYDLADTKNIGYSQSNRMDLYWRDCSSFVSRCYWDNRPNHKRSLFAIGGEQGKTWALPAGAQAKWLYDQDCTVAWKAVSAKKLRPGDTLYFETRYASEWQTDWRGIDHAAIYVGNGRYIHTGGGGSSGAITMSGYYSDDSSIKFIGRPCW